MTDDILYKAAAGLGHNQPPLAERMALDHADLLKSAEDAAAAIPKDLAEIFTEEEAATYTEAAANLKKINSALDRTFKAEKQPWLDGGRAVDQFFAAARAPLSAAAARVVTAISRWQEKKRANQKKAEADAAAKLAAEATPFDDEPPFDRHHKAAVTPADAVRVTASSGAKASGTVKWTYRVVHPDLVPRQYLTINDAAVKAAVAALKARDIPIEDAQIAIDGIEIYETIVTSIR